jgi:mRNA interferase RelE/StbE
VTDAPEFYLLAFTPTARRQLTGQLPEAVSAAAHAFILGSLLDHPNRAEARAPPTTRRPAQRPLWDLPSRPPTSTEDPRTVTVLDVAHRRDAYRTTG